MAAILKPLGNCAELLNQSAVNPMLSKCIEFAVNYVTSLKDKDLKNKVTITLNGLIINWFITILNIVLF
jgi:Mn2+/Fe2+ NRAMP family transporter